MSTYMLLLMAALSAPEIPGALPDGPVALVGATLFPVNGGPIEDGVLILEAGKIVAIGKDIDVPANAERIDVTGKRIYPGLFDAYTHLGLTEVSSVRSSVDYRELGSINPNVSAHVAVNPDSELIPVTRSNGVLLSLAAPSGSLITGKSAVLQLDGWTWEDLTLKSNVALHINWPRMAPVTNWLDTRSTREQAASRDRALRSLESAFEDAGAYAKARRSGTDHHVPYNSRWEAMLPVLDGELPVIVEANEVQEIQAAVAVSRRIGFPMILFGGYDAPQCAELLKENDIPVIVAAVYRLPARRADPYDHAFTLPDRLRRAGLRYCISGDERTSNTRRLPYHAAMAVAFGLPADEALKAITLYPAEILGVADRVGSLEVGKDATLFVTDGDPLETASQVEAAFVQGRPVELNDRHKRLWRKYGERLRQLDGE